MPKQTKANRRTAESNTYRFFVEPSAFQGERVRLEDKALVHQLSSVLRLQAGQQITLLDNTGMQYTVQLELITKQVAEATVLDQTVSIIEPRCQVILYCALLRAERFEWVLQKGTEIGVHSFVPLICDHNLVDGEAAREGAKVERWRRIIREAAEQARRGRLPELRPAQTFAAASVELGAAAQPVLLWENSGAQSLRTMIQTRPAEQRWAVLSGPEGGWSEAEHQQALAAQIPLISLGQRTLRAETAPIVAATALLFAAGDLD